MIYLFDTGSFSKLKHFYPSVFKSVWIGLDTLVTEGLLLSTKEVWNELEGGDPHKPLQDWLKARKNLFTTPTQAELSFVGRIFAVDHFQTLIGEKQRLRGMPVADPFVIAAAAIRGGTVVSEEQFKPNAAKIPNVCRHFSIGCVSLEEFMAKEGWQF